MAATDRSELDRFKLYYEAPRRSEELNRTIAQVTESIRRGWARIAPLMPYFGKRHK